MHAPVNDIDRTPPSDRDRGRLISLLFACLFVSGAGAECPDLYHYVIIADAGDSPFSGFERTPAISRGGHVAFVGFLDDVGSGIFAGNGRNDPVTLALDRDADPESDFVSFGPGIAVSDESAVQAAFRAQVIHPQNQLAFEIHRINFGFPPVSIARDRNADPESKFWSLGEHIDLRINGDVIFSALLDNAASSAIVMSGGGQAYQFLASHGDGHVWPGEPSASFNDNWYAYLAYQGTLLSADNSMIVRGHAQGGNVVVYAADPDTSDFVSSPVVSGGGAVAYLYHYPSPSQPGFLASRLVRWRDGGQQAVIADSELDPLRLDHRTVPSFGAGGCVVFEAFDFSNNPGRRLFAGDGDEPALVLDRFSELFDGVVYDFEIGRHGANAGGQAAIWIELGYQSGNTVKTRELIIRADPDPIFSANFGASAAPQNLRSTP